MNIARTLRNFLLVSVIACASYYVLLDEDARNKAGKAAKTLLTTARDLYKRLEDLRGQEIDDGLEREINALRQRWEAVGF